MESAEPTRGLRGPPVLEEPLHGIDGLSRNIDVTEEGRNQQPQPPPHLAGEEVGGPQHVHMPTNELAQRPGLFALRSWWEAVTMQDDAYRLVTDRIAQVGQRTHDAGLPPRALLSGHPHH